MKKFLTAFLAASFLVACSEAPESVADETPTAPQLSESQFAKYTGVYSGSYVCSLGENGITISIDTIVDLIGAEGGPTGKVDGRLWFYDVMSNPGHPSGAFKLSGTITDAGFDLEPVGWITIEPDNWGAAGIEGEFVDLGAVMNLIGQPTGFGTAGCEGFALKRLEGL